MFSATTIKDSPLCIGLQPMNPGSPSPVSHDFSSAASQGPASSIRSIYFLEVEGVRAWAPALVIWHQCLEELLIHPLNTVGAVEAPRDKAKSGTGFISHLEHGHRILSSCPVQCQVDLRLGTISERWRKIYSNTESTVTLSLR